MSRSPDAWAESLVGAELAGRYRLEEILGRGSFGVVYVGTHTRTERRVALKVLEAGLAKASPTLAKRFLREAKAAASLRHENVVEVLDMGEDAGTAFLVLELLEGEPLSDRVEREGTIEVPAALAILLPILDALHDAHGRGMIHRDVKAENIFLHHDEGLLVPKILDFGIVRTSDADEAMLTRRGSLLGTPQYMAPEQVAGQRVTSAADIWSCGVLLFRMLSGRFPFEGTNPSMLLVSVVTTPVPELTELAPGVAPGITDAVMRALAKDPASRHADMHAFMDALLDGAREAGIDAPDPRRSQR